MHPYVFVTLALPTLSFADISRKFLQFQPLDSCHVVRPKAIPPRAAKNLEQNFLSNRHFINSSGVNDLLVQIKLIILISSTIRE